MNLEVMGWAFQVRWLWLRKTDTAKLWLSLDIPTHSNVLALFQIAMKTIIGNVSTTKFWKDKWIHGKSLVTLHHASSSGSRTASRQLPSCLLAACSACNHLYPAHGVAEQLSQVLDLPRLLVDVGGGGGNRGSHAPPLHGPDLIWALAQQRGRAGWKPPTLGSAEHTQGRAGQRCPTRGPTECT